MKPKDHVTAVVPMTAYESEDSLVINAGEVGEIVAVHDEWQPDIYEIAFSGGRKATALAGELNPTGETSE